MGASCRSSAAQGVEGGGAPAVIQGRGVEGGGVQGREVEGAGEGREVKGGAGMGAGESGCVSYPVMCKLPCGLPKSSEQLSVTPPYSCHHTPLTAPARLSAWKVSP